MYPVAVPDAAAQASAWARDSSAGDSASGHTMNNAGSAPTARMFGSIIFDQRISESRLICTVDGPCCSTTYSQSKLLIASSAAPLKMWSMIA